MEYGVSNDSLRFCVNDAWEKVQKQYGTTRKFNDG
jgi:hypothetical protein